MIKKDIEILKNLFLPSIEEMYQFAPQLKSSIQEDTFWDHLNSILFDNSKTTEFLQKNGIPKVDYFLDRFKELRKEYISQLAFQYCNGEINTTIEHLLNSNYKLFIDEVNFQQNLKQAITISEREKLKRKLSLLDEAAAFEIADNEITSAFELIQKKNEHESLKRKMLEWDKSEVSSSSNVIPFPNTVQPTEGRNSPEERKTIPISFIRYAAAACFVGVMVWIGVRFYNQPKENIVAVNSTDTFRVPRKVVQEPVFAKVEESQQSLPLIKETGIGFAKSGTKSKIKIAVQNLSPRIASIEAYLSSPQKDSSEVKYRIAASKELDSLKMQSDRYVFDGKTLQLYSSLVANPENIVVAADQKFYLKRGDSYFYLKAAVEPQKFKKVTDEYEKEKLERIYFDSGK